MLPRQLRPPFQVAPEAILQIGKKMLEMLADRYNLRHGCKVPFRRWALAGQAKATLHPLAFYTIEVTSPGKEMFLTGDAGDSVIRLSIRTLGGIGPHFAGAKGGYSFKSLPSIRFQVQLEPASEQCRGAARLNSLLSESDSAVVVGRRKAQRLKPAVFGGSFGTIEVEP